MLADRVPEHSQYLGYELQVHHDSQAATKDLEPPCLGAVARGASMEQRKTPWTAPAVDMEDTKRLLQVGKGCPPVERAEALGEKWAEPQAEGSPLALVHRVSWTI